jgi:hypothetical protein
MFGCGYAALWFHNTWTWNQAPAKPSLRAIQDAPGTRAVAGLHPELGDCLLYCEGNPNLLFTENETNYERLFRTPNASPFVKDGFHNHVIHGRTAAVNPEQTGSKAAAHYVVTVNPGQSTVIRLRLARTATAELFGESFEDVFALRHREADEYYT